jgi:predicted nucleotidyltransferase
MSIDPLHAHRRAILELATRNGARNVRVFGSAARGEAGRPATSISSSMSNRDVPCST